jgi:hypothetical protein
MKKRQIKKLYKKEIKDLTKKELRIILKDCGFNNFKNKKRESKKFVF